MSNNAYNRLCYDIGNKKTRKPVIFIVGLAAMLFFAIGNPVFADNNTAMEIASPLWVNDLESLDAGTSLTLSESTYEIMKELHTVSLTDFPLSRTKSVDLELEQFSIITPKTRIVAGTEQGDIPVSPPDISLFRGSVADANDSRVVLGISPRGCHGFILYDQKGYVINPTKRTKESGGQLSHVIHELSELPEPAPGTAPGCGGTLAPAEELTPIEPVSTEMTPNESAAAPFRSLRLALECDYEYWDQFNNIDEALEYIYVLFGWGNYIFHNDVSINITLTFVRIWTTINDPYSYKGGEDTALEEFKDYWNANHNPGQPGFVERDLAHLLSSRGINGWGRQSGALCSYYVGYSCSGGNHLLPTLPENLVHDVTIVFHELGHNHNAQHTHEFDPPIDCCVAEGNCQEQDCNDAPSTMMSYCHQCPGGNNNILWTFHPLNINRMLSTINASCLRFSQNPCYVDWRNTSGIEDGTATNPYNTVKEGVEGVLPDGTLSIANGLYPEVNWQNLVTDITIWQPMTLTATGGTVTIGQ